MGDIDFQSDVHGLVANRKLEHEQGLIRCVSLKDLQEASPRVDLSARHYFPICIYSPHRPRIFTPHEL